MTYMSCGAPIERIVPPPPYSLKVFWQDGRVTIQGRSHNPVEARALESKVARNTAVIKRIELHDHEGCIETIWSQEGTYGTEST